MSTPLNINKSINSAIFLKCLNMPMKLLMSIAVARFLTKDLYGFFSLLISVQSISVYFFGTGIIQAIARFLPEFFQKNEVWATYLVTMKLLLLRSVIVVGWVCVLIHFAPELFSYFNFPPDASTYLWEIVLLICLPRLCEVPGLHFRMAALNFDGISLHDIIRTGLLLFAITGVYYGFLQSTGEIVNLLLWLEVFSVLYFGIWFLSSIYRVYQASPASVRAGVALSSHAGRIGRYSFYSSLYGFGGIGVGTGVDSLIVARNFGIEQVGLYAFSLSLVMMIHSLNPVVFLKNVILNLLNRQYAASGDPSDVAKGASLVWRAGIYFAVPGLVLLLTHLDPIIRLVYQSPFEESGLLVSVFCVVVVVRVAALACYSIITTLEMTKHLVIYNCFGVVNIILGILLAYRFGVVGVGSATVISELAWVFYLTRVIRSRCEFRLTLFDGRFMSIIINSAIAIIGPALLAPRFESLFSLLFVLSLSALFYIGLSHRFSCFSSQERKLMITHSPLLRFLI